MTRWSRVMHEHWTNKHGKLVAKVQFRTLDDCLAFMEKKGIKILTWEFSRVKTGS